MNASASNALDQVRAFFGIAEPEPAISTTNSSPTAEPAEPTFFAGESPFDSFSDGDFTSTDFRAKVAALGNYDFDDSGKIVYSAP